MAGRAEVLRRVHGVRVRLAGRRLEEHLVETDVAPAARVGAAAGQVPSQGGVVGVARALVVCEIENSLVRGVGELGFGVSWRAESRTGRWWGCRLSGRLVVSSLAFIDTWGVLMGSKAAKASGGWNTIYKCNSYVELPLHVGMNVHRLDHL